MQKTLKTHFAQNLGAYNKFYLNRAFNGFFWLWIDSAKLIWFYMSIQTYIVL